MSASIITIGALAVQTVGALQKTYELCSSIKHTPRDLRLLLEELQLLSVLLNGFRDSASQPAHDASKDFLSALKHCEDTLESIRFFCTVLEHSIMTTKRGLRPLAVFKATLSEKKVKKYLNRLDRAKSMLSLAHQCSMQ